MCVRSKRGRGLEGGMVLGRVEEITQRCVDWHTHVLVFTIGEGCVLLSHQRKSQGTTFVIKVILFNFTPEDAASLQAT